MAAKKKADAAVENTAEVTQETTEQVQDTVCLLYTSPSPRD